MRNSLNNKFSRKKRIIFLILTVFLIFLVIEWSGRLFVTLKDFNEKKRERNNQINFDIEYHKMIRRDSDIGHFFYTENPRILDRGEFKSEFYFIDLGVDSLFFRDDGIDIERKKRLLAVGDSFVWGVGVELEEIFTELMEEVDSDLDVINAGMSGFTPQQYTRIIKRFIKNHINFDGVLYSFFGGNDLSYEYKFREWAEMIKKFPSLAPASYMRYDLISYKAAQYELAKRIDNLKTANQGLVESFFKDWFVSFRICRKLYDILAERLKIKSDNDINNYNWYLFKKDPVVKGNNGKKTLLRSEYINEAAGETLSQSQLDHKAIYQLNFPLAVESIVEAKNICDSLNIDFYLVYIPSKAEVYADALCSTLEEPQRTSVRMKLKTLHQDMLLACDAHNIKVIDLYDECIKEEKQGSQLYYNTDSHFNKNGHKLWAKVVLDYIANEK